MLAMLGDSELEPGYTTKTYLCELVGDNLLDGAGLMPLSDAVEVVRDASQRNTLAIIGHALAARATSQTSPVGDIAGEAVQALDDVLSSLRAGARLSYDAEGAALTALAHLDSSERQYPTTGLADLDAATGGWPLGQLSIWAGRPGMGKSACASSAVLRAGKAGFGVGFFSLEMQGEQLGARLLTDLAFTGASPIYYEDILNRRIDEQQRRRLNRAAEALDGLPIRIEEQRGLNLAEIQSRARKMANTFARDGQKLSVLFIDHMGLVRASSRYAGNRVNEVSEISDGLATLAKDLDVAVVALSQLNRGVEGRDNKRPGLSDLRDSWQPSNRTPAL